VAAPENAPALAPTFKTRWYLKYFPLGVALLAVAAAIVYADFRLLDLDMSSTAVVAVFGAFSAFLGVGCFVAMRSRACTGCGAEAQMKYLSVASEASAQIQAAFEGEPVERVIDAIVAHRRSFWQPSKHVACLYCAGCRSLATLEVTGWKTRTLLGEDARRLVAFVHQ
jgi:hypothetical protein